MLSIGSKFGKLTIQNLSVNILTGNIYCTTKCECGEVKDVMAKYLVRGNIDCCDNCQNYLLVKRGNILCTQDTSTVKEELTLDARSVATALTLVTHTHL